MPEVDSDYPKFLKLLADANTTQNQDSEARQQEVDAAKAYGAAKQSASDARIKANASAESFLAFMKANKGRAYVADKVGYVWSDTFAFNSIFSLGVGGVIAFSIITGEPHVPKPEDGPRDS